MVSLEQAKKLIGLARSSINSYFTNEDISKTIDSAFRKEFSNKQGVFVSLYSGSNLRGCIGYAEPVLPLWQAIILAAKSAAFEDSRFPSIKQQELKKLTIELSVLTVPQLINVKSADEYPSNVAIGVDGLIIMDKFESGLLLPQVAQEYGWNATEFLNQTCVKAGMEPDCWKDLKKRIYKFQAQVFREENGKTVEELVN